MGSAGGKDQMSQHVRRPRLVLGLVFLALVGLPGAVAADHRWESYHWARQTNPFTLTLGDNVSSAWDSHLRRTASDWSASVVLDATIVAGSTRRATCLPTTGRVEVCNSTYGDTGWLGLTQLWTSGDHITQATVRVNDTYFDSPKYDTPAYRKSAICHEIGHTLGLDHQDEDFWNPNLGTCMDLTNDPRSNQHPDRRDYRVLKSIYVHTDSTTTTATAPEGRSVQPAAAPQSWGDLVSGSAHSGTQTFVADLGDGRQVITFVTSAG